MILIIGVLIIIFLFIITKKEETKPVEENEENEETEENENQSADTNTPQGVNSYVDKYKDIKTWEECWSGTPRSSIYNCYNKMFISDKNTDFVNVSGNTFCENPFNTSQFNTIPLSKCIAPYASDGQVLDDNITCSTLLKKPQKYICKDPNTTIIPKNKKKTSYRNRNYGRITRLNGHTLRCDGNNDAIQSIKMNQSGNDLQFEYECGTKHNYEGNLGPETNVPNNGNQHSNSWWGDTENGMIRRYLKDGHKTANNRGQFWAHPSITCQNNHVLSGIEYHNDDDNTLYVKPRCRSFQTKSCREKVSNAKHDSQWKTYNMWPHMPMACNKDEFMKGFHLESHNGGYRWRYTCCK